MSNALENFINFYNAYDLTDTESFHKLYSDNVHFEDSFHRVKGRENLHAYFQKVSEGLSYCHFEVIEYFISGVNSESGDASAMILWSMEIRHPKLNKNKSYTVEGATHILFDEKVKYHKDYFDSASLIYRKLPVVGSLIKFIEKRMA